MTESLVPEDAKEIFRELQSGTNIAEPNVYPHSLVFSDHARLYLENAEDLCDAGTTDFAVFGALYCTRHGLELWLKCFLRNFHIDKFLSAVNTAQEVDFDELCQHLDINGQHEKSVREALCVMRNVLEDGITFPECRTRRQENRYADQALDFIRENGAQHPRQCFASLWTHSGSWSHDLLEIWRDGAATELLDFHSSARSFPNDYSHHMANPDRIKAICQFFHHFDESGNAFRYPISRQAEWRFDLPNLSLTALGEMARELAQSVIAYRAIRREVYNSSTLADPRVTLRI